METKRALEQRLEGVAAFECPNIEYEQYSTPAHLAAALVHLADLEGDLDRLVVDLGTGTGVLALGAALRNATEVVGIDRDPAALRIAGQNESKVESTSAIEWILADATRPPLSLSDVTVLMNPPFGAQRGHEHADRAFLQAVAAFPTVSYSIHNGGSWEFVEAYAADNGGRITHAYESTISLDRQFPFHDQDTAEIAVELFRIDWS